MNKLSVKLSTMSEHNHCCVNNRSKLLCAYGFTDINSMLCNINTNTKIFNENHIFEWSDKINGQDYLVFKSTKRSSLNRVTQGWVSTIFDAITDLLFWTLVNFSQFLSNYLKIKESLLYIFTPRININSGNINQNS